MYTWNDYSDSEVETTVTEIEYDNDGRLVKETRTVTKTRKPNRAYPYNYQVYGSNI